MKIAFLFLMNIMLFSCIISGNVSQHQQNKADNFTNFDSSKRDYMNDFDSQNQGLYYYVPVKDGQTTKLPDGDIVYMPMRKIKHWQDQGM